MFPPQLELQYVNIQPYYIHSFIIFFIFQLNSPKPASNTTPSKMSKPIKNVDSKLAALILDEIVDGGVGVSFGDIAGLQVNLAFYSCELVFLLHLLP